MNDIERKKKRLKEFILPLLICINCKSDHLLLLDSSETIVCNDCGTKYPVHNGTPIMMSDPDEAFQFTDECTVNIMYTDQYTTKFPKYSDNLILDLGAGNNPETIGNIIKLDVFAFPHVDIAASAESLPFNDEVFSLVISGAVFEHIKNPCIARDEIDRVLTKGGEVYIETAFLQPVHAYPSHYYNMTKYGLESLFSGFELIDSGVKEHQYPSFTLKWILEVWASKMSFWERQLFYNTRIKSIIKKYKKNPGSKKWLKSFNKKDVEELACGVFYNGIKK